MPTNTHPHSQLLHNCLALIPTFLSPLNQVSIFRMEAYGPGHCFLTIVFIRPEFALLEAG